MQSSMTPINNQYFPIDIKSLKSNNYKLVNKARKIRGESVLEIKKYLKELNTLGGKESLILNSKKVLVESNQNPKKSSYYERVDMLIPRPQKLKDEKMQTIIQRYLKSFTTLDIELQKNQSVLYEFNSKTLNTKILNKNVYKILEYSFFEMSSLISQPIFYVSPENVIINLFYLVLNKRRNLNTLKLQNLLGKLSKFFKKPVKLELTQLYSVSHNSQILVKVLGKLGLSRRNSFSRIIGRFLKYQAKKIIFRNTHKKLFRFSSILTGVNIKLGGRLMRGKIIPRRSVNKIQYGSLARSKSNYVTTARLTQKNKRGSFSFTVSMGHKFF